MSSLDVLISAFFCDKHRICLNRKTSLKALSDHITGENQSRAIAFYTSSYGIGTAASVFFSGLPVSWLHWRQAAVLLSIGYIGAVLIFALTVEPKTPASPVRKHPLSSFKFREALRNRSAVGYISGYAVHCWELFGFRSWMVAFLAFSLTLFVSPLTFGFILDMTGSGIFGWGLAYASLGAVSMSGPLWLRLFRNANPKNV